MPYNKIEDLPSSIRDRLPIHAQEIYLKAFSNAYDEYKNKEKRYTNESREEVSHKVAWAAVKKIYKKDEENLWVKK